MKKKHYREFHCKEYMYGFIGENRYNLKKYHFRKYYSVFDNLYFILEYEKIDEDKKDITHREILKENE